jgi:hypothetical protein
MFLGLSCSNSRSEKLNDLVKRIIPLETSIPKVFFAIHDISIKQKIKAYTIIRDSLKYETLLKDDGVAEVRQVVSKSIMRSFIGTYVRGMRNQV